MSSIVSALAVYIHCLCGLELARTIYNKTDGCIARPCIKEMLKLYSVGLTDCPSKVPSFLSHLHQRIYVYENQQSHWASATFANSHGQTSGESTIRAEISTKQDFPRQERRQFFRISLLSANKKQASHLIIESNFTNVFYHKLHSFWPVPKAVKPVRYYLMGIKRA